MATNTHDVLADLIARASCKPGWSFRLETKDDILRMYITVLGPDTNNPCERIRIGHESLVPTATYNAKTWRRWIFEQCRRVENHELGEWFKIDGKRSFPPLHGPGEDPYTVHEFRDEVDSRTLQNGTVVEALSL
jgi:hypothetical protein